VRFTIDICCEKLIQCFSQLKVLTIVLDPDLYPTNSYRDYQGISVRTEIVAGSLIRRKLVRIRNYVRRFVKGQGSVLVGFFFFGGGGVNHRWGQSEIAVSLEVLLYTSAV
jgi:hypothetical protein